MRFHEEFGPNGSGTQPPNCRIEVRERGNLLGFLRPDGKISPNAQDAAALTKTQADRALVLLYQFKQTTPRTFRISEG